MGTTSEYGHESPPESGNGGGKGSPCEWIRGTEKKFSLLSSCYPTNSGDVHGVDDWEHEATRQFSSVLFDMAA